VVILDCRGTLEGDVVTVDEGVVVLLDLIFLLGGVLNVAEAFVFGVNDVFEVGGLVFGVVQCTVGVLGAMGVFDVVGV